MKVGFIYKITSPNKRVYIGQTIDVQRRIREYKRMYHKSQIRVFNSLKKYGFDNHIFEVLTECDQSELNKWERYYQDLYSSCGKNGLNCSLTGYNGSSGSMSEATKKKISEKRILLVKKWRLENDGEYPKFHCRYPERKTLAILEYNKTDKAKIFLKNIQNKRIGTTHSELTKQKISRSRIERGIKPWNIGILRTEEEKSLISKTKLEKNYKGENNKNSQIILNTETGIYYFGCNEASLSLSKIGRYYLGEMLNGRKRNKTNFIKT